MDQHRHSYRAAVRLWSKFGSECVRKIGLNLSQNMSYK